MPNRSADTGRNMGSYLSGLPVIRWQRGVSDTMQHLDFETLLEMKSSPKTVVAYAPGTKTPQPFAFVLNVSRLVGGSSLEIIPGRTLRRADDGEIEFTKGVITSLFANHSSGGLWETRRPKSGQSKFVRLPKRQWRYFVIEFSGGNQEVELLERALSIAPCRLDVGFILSVSSLRGRKLPVCVYRPPRLFQSLSAMSHAAGSVSGLAKAVTKFDAEQVRKIYLKLATHDNRTLDLDRVFKLVFELMDLPRFSPLQILGYFAVLESILTHAPNPDDRYDSITRQIKQKLALLNKRWKPPLDYSAFSGLSHDKVWSKMYAYRSAIAHGSTPNFAGELSVLGKAESADLLISEAVRKTICQALEEPQLLADLQNC
jgi:hypothetical protein